MTCCSSILSCNFICLWASLGHVWLRRISQILCNDWTIQLLAEDCPSTRTSLILFLFDGCCTLVVRMKTVEFGCWCQVWRRVGSTGASKKHKRSLVCCKNFTKDPSTLGHVSQSNSSRQYFAKINCSICSYPFNQWIVRHWRTLIKSIFGDRGTRSTCRRSSRCPWHCTIALWRQSERTHTPPYNNNTPTQSNPQTSTSQPALIQLTEYRLSHFTTCSNEHSTRFPAHVTHILW